MWGEDAISMMRLKRPTLFWHFEHGVKEMALGLRHGIALDRNNNIYGWGDGTYGELG